MLGCNQCIDGVGQHRTLYWLIVVVMVLPVSVFGVGRSGSFGANISHLQPVLTLLLFHHFSYRELSCLFFFCLELDLSYCFLFGFHRLASHSGGKIKLGPTTVNRRKSVNNKYFFFAFISLLKPDILFIWSFEESVQFPNVIEWGDCKTKPFCVGFDCLMQNLKPGLSLFSIQRKDDYFFTNWHLMRTK